MPKEARDKALNELKKLKISRSKWEKNVDVYEKNWRDSHIDVTKRNERIERLAERTELLQRHSKLEKAWKACEQHRLSALKSLENAAFPPDISDRLDKWEAKINEYKRLYHEVTGTHPEEEEEKPRRALESLGRRRRARAQTTKRCRSATTTASHAAALKESKKERKCQRAHLCNGAFVEICWQLKSQ